MAYHVDRGTTVTAVSLVKRPRAVMIVHTPSCCLQVGTKEGHTNTLEPHDCGTFHFTTHDCYVARNGASVRA